MKIERQAGVLDQLPNKPENMQPDHQTHQSLSQMH